MTISSMNWTINIAKLGRQWFGESFDIKQDQEFEFNFPNIDVSTPKKLKQLQLLQLIPRLLFRLLLVDKPLVTYPFLR
jgi:hypothetical protein